MTTFAGQAEAPALPAARAPATARLENDAVCLLGLPFDTLSLAETVERLRAAAFSNSRCFVSTPNLNFLIAAHTDPAFRDSVLRSDLSLPDGAPIVWMARAIGLPITRRVAGASVFEALRAHDGPPLGVFFFGGTAGAAEAACRNLNAEAGGLRGVGFDEAGFGSLDSMSTPERIARINASSAHFVVVSLGAKKGQAWIERNASTLQAPLLCHLGAVVNFVAGTISRAPPWVQRSGFEWLWRIKEEPALWRRYLNDGAALARLAALRLPACARMRMRSAVAPQPPRFEVEQELGAPVVYTLEGAWLQASLAPLQRAFGDAVRAGQALDVSLRGVSDVDAAFIALLMRVYGSVGRENLRLRDVPERIRKTFWCNAADFLLD